MNSVMGYGFQGQGHSDKQRRNYWTPALKTLGLPQSKKFIPYNLRHTYACDLIARGLALPLIAEQMGHENVSTTLAHYGKWIDGDQNELEIAKLEANLKANLKTQISPSLVPGILKAS